MQLNHANLCVPDVPAATEFFTRHFDFSVQDNRNDAFVIMTDEKGFVFNLMQTGKGDTGGYPANFHIGFFVESEDIVRAKHAELIDAGYGPGEVRQFNRGGVSMVTFYCQAPGGFLVEVAYSE